MTIIQTDFTAAKATPTPTTLCLGAKELAAIEELIHLMMQQFDSVETSAFAQYCEVLATRLPEEIFAALRSTSSGDDPSSYLQIKGFEVHPNSIGPTPDHWDQPWESQPYTDPIRWPRR